MKREELEKIAKELCKMEEEAENSNLSEEEYFRKVLEITLSYKLNLTDMFEIDEIVQEMMEKDLDEAVERLRNK